MKHETTRKKIILGMICNRKDKFNSMIVITVVHMCVVYGVKC